MYKIALILSATTILSCSDNETRCCRAINSNGFAAPCFGLDTICETDNWRSAMLANPEFFVGVDTWEGFAAVAITDTSCRWACEF